MQRAHSLNLELRSSMNALKQQEAAAYESTHRDEVVRHQLEELRYKHWKQIGACISRAAHIVALCNFTRLSWAACVSEHLPWS